MITILKKMKFSKILTTVLLIISFSQGYGQASGDAGSMPAGDTVKVNALLQQTKECFSSDPEKAFALSSQAKARAQSIGFKKGAALACKNTGIVYY